MADTATTQTAAQTTAAAKDVTAELQAHIAKVKADIEAGAVEFDKLFPDWLGHIENVLKTFRLPAADLPAVEAEIKAVTQEIVAYVVAKLSVPSVFAAMIESAVSDLVERFLATELAKFVA